MVNEIKQKNLNAVQDKNHENDGRRFFFVAGTFHKGAKKDEKSKLRKGREEFLWKKRDENEASVL